ncbi:MAG: LysR family transcriptional regulator, partial [Xanthobacteraceae bacterium]|nr:LysR family transcriptional regulator [Xanthobacteraceae bacterium]
ITPSCPIQRNHDQVLPSSEFFSSLLGMSQPAVSAAIANLEVTLGVRLLDRNPRGIEPTIYSKALLKRGRVAFDELRQGLRDVEFLLDPAAGEVRVGCPEGTAAGFVPAVIDRLTQRHPRVVVHVVTAQTGTQEFRELRERNVDVMLGRLFKPTVDEDIDVEIVGRDRLFVAASSHAPWVRRRKVSLVELIEEPWVLYPSDNVVGAFHADAFRRNGLELPRRQIISYSLDVRMHLLATGRYLTMLGSQVLLYNSERWSLKRLPIDLHAPEMPIAIFTLKNRTISPVAQLFVEGVRTLAKSDMNI